MRAAIEAAIEAAAVRLANNAVALERGNTLRQAQWDAHRRLAEQMIRELVRLVGERTEDRVQEGIKYALAVTRLAGCVLNLLPEGLRTRDLFDQIIATIAPHVTADNLDRLPAKDAPTARRSE